VRHPFAQLADLIARCLSLGVDAFSQFISLRVDALSQFVSLRVDALSQFVSLRVDALSQPNPLARISVRRLRNEVPIATRSAMVAQTTVQAVASM